MVRLGVLTICLLFSHSAEAGTVFDFSYFGEAHQAHGTLTAVDNGDGSFTAVSGGGLFDTYSLSLIPNPVAPGTATSSTGYFYYDNQLFPAGNPLILNGGLLFAVDTGTATELNIYSNGPYPATQYTSYLNDGNWDNGEFTLARIDLELFAASSVPEPITVFLVATGLL